MVESWWGLSEPDEYGDSIPVQDLYEMSVADRSCSVCRMSKMKMDKRGDCVLVCSVDGEQVDGVTGMTCFSAQEIPGYHG